MDEEELTEGEEGTEEGEGEGEGEEREGEEREEVCTHSELAQLYIVQITECRVSTALAVTDVYVCRRKR